MGVDRMQEIGSAQPGAQPQFVLHRMHGCKVLVPVVDSMCIPSFLAAGASAGATPGRSAQVGWVWQRRLSCRPLLMLWSPAARL
jgi:hypothetical protein